MDVLLLAIALSMDAFAVSIGLGARPSDRLFPLSLKAGLYFGFFQGVMPLIGYLIGLSLIHYIEKVDHWIAFFLLLFIGAKMLYESFIQESECDVRPISNRLMFTLAIATSIDALAAGYTLSLLSLKPWVSVIMIGVITSLFSSVGVYIGRYTGTFFESKAERVGGVTLILIGAKILYDHLG